VDLGLPLLLAFSAGLACTLIGVGLGVVWTKRFTGARLTGRGRLARLFRVLPVASALFVTAIGLWLCYESIHT
jgi:ABC-type nickel/cobalt efflux system permease component RcnA